MFQGQSLHVRALNDGVVEIVFDRQGDAINKFDGRTVEEFRQATGAIAAAVASNGSVRGVLVTSAKKVFIVGADITEFGRMFQQPMADLVASIGRSNEAFNAFEDLPVPTVVAINGLAFGGGLEMCLSAALRVMADDTLVGVPEVKLGLFPGFGGTVRLPRLAGARVAVDWVASGQPQSAATALRVGVVDEVAAPAALRDAALAMLARAMAGAIDWRTAQQRKRVALPLSKDAVGAVFGVALLKVQAKAGKHQPAAIEATKMMRRAALLDRAGALAEEGLAFGQVAKTQAAGAMVQSFLSEQQLKKLVKQHTRQARPVRQIAVLGTGALARDIAGLSVRRGVPAHLQDAAVAKPLDRTDFRDVDLVIDLQVDGADEPADALAARRTMLAEIEAAVRADTVIALDTATLRIDDVAQVLLRPENFVGMCFGAHAMTEAPTIALVEVLRGHQSSDVAVATAVAFAAAMGKTVIVVNGGHGSLVQRVLASYRQAVARLVDDGVDAQRVDQALQDFGWPAGSAGRHAHGTPANAPALTPPYAPARAPRIEPRQLSDSEILERAMLPLIITAARALEEGVVASAAELDQALLLGMSFPAYLGGALKYADWLGLSQVVQRAQHHAALGPAYTPTVRMLQMAASGARFYGD